MVQQKEFMIWLSGYVDAIQSTPTQSQWDYLKSKVKSEINSNIFITPLSTGYGTSSNTAVINTTTSISGSSIIVGSTDNLYPPFFTTNTNVDRFYGSKLRYGQTFTNAVLSTIDVLGNNQLELEFEPK